MRVCEDEVNVCEVSEALVVGLGDGVRVAANPARKVGRIVL